MVMIGVGLAVVALLLWAADSFSRANVATVKSLLAWVAALAGLSLAAMLLLTGRAGAAIGGAVLFGPLIWQEWQRHSGRHSGRPGRAPPPAPRGRMSRAEALSVLGLHDPASEEEVRAAWKRLMQNAHPDRGGTDWLAAKLNEAKDVLLRGR